MFLKKSARRGYTLIELLVVIGVISVLAGIIFPIYSRAREGGRTAACSSNLKQLGQAFAQYRQDNVGKSPWAAPFQNTEKPGAPYWIRLGEAGMAKNYTDKGLAAHEDTSDFEYEFPREAYPEQGALFAYVKNAAVYVCPSMRDRQKRLSYSMNCAVSGLPDTRIKEPENIILLVDEGKTLNDGYYWATDNGTKAPGNSTDSLTSVHNGGGNILFFDGHVKRYPFDVLPLDWNPTGKALKQSTKKGTIRFRDVAFGPYGAYKLPSDTIDPDWAGVNMCGEK